MTGVAVHAEAPRADIMPLPHGVQTGELPLLYVPGGQLLQEVESPNSPVPVNGWIQILNVYGDQPFPFSPAAHEAEQDVAPTVVEPGHEAQIFIVPSL